MTNTNKGLIIAAIIIILLAKPKKAKAESLITMKTSKAEDLIKLSEGLRLKAYLDPVGIYTIGWGNIFNFTKNGQYKKTIQLQRQKRNYFLIYICKE